MPPQQCPSCGRFLKNDLIAALADGPRPCPRCETALRAEQFADGPVADEPATDGGPAADRAVATDPRPDGSPAEIEVEPDAAPDGAAPTSAPSVRPPDLVPEEVRDVPRDVLTGWDVDADAAEIASWRADERPFPLDTVLVAGGAVIGALAGAALTEEHRVRRGLGGALAGAVALGLVRRVWRLG